MAFLFVSVRVFCPDSRLSVDMLFKHQMVNHIGSTVMSPWNQIPHTDLAHVSKTMLPTDYRVMSTHMGVDHEVEKQNSVEAVRPVVPLYRHIWQYCFSLFGLHAVCVGLCRIMFAPRLVP